MKSISEEESNFLRIFRENLSTNIGLHKLLSNDDDILCTDAEPPHNEMIITRSMQRGILNKEYDGVKIKYNLNNRGYRIYSDLNEKSPTKIFCFGCSFTFGLAIPDEHTWPYQLGKLFGEDCYVRNFGINGSSVGFSAMLFNKIMNTIDKDEYPKAVFFLFPDPFRYYYIGNDGIQAKSSHENMSYYVAKTFDEYKKTKKDPFKVNRYAHDSIIDSFLKFVKYFNMIKETAKNKNIPWYWHTWSPSYYHIEKNVLEQYVDTHNTKIDKFGISPIQFLGFGSDGTHWNGKTNGKLASTFHELYLKDNKTS